MLGGGGPFVFTTVSAAGWTVVCPGTPCRIKLSASIGWPQSPVAEPESGWQELPHGVSPHCPQASSESVGELGAE